VIEKSSIENFVDKYGDLILGCIPGLVVGLLVGLTVGYFAFSGGNVASQDQLEQAKLKALELEYLEGRVKSLEEKASKAIQQKPSGQAQQAVQVELKEITIFTIPNCPPCENWKAIEWQRFQQAGWKVMLCEPPNHGYSRAPTFEIQRGSRRSTHVGYLSLEAAERIGL
jgi:hypothetical protein